MPSLKPGYETKPATPVPLSFRPGDSVKHEVSDGEDWHKVAKRYNLDVYELIFSNFKTNVPREVNWYLREYIRCDLPTADRKNWRFSTSARFGGGPRPGVVYIPLNWPAIVAAAKKATRALVQEWFHFVTLGPQGTQVDGPMLIVQPSALRPLMNKQWPAFEAFRFEVREAGAPDKLAKVWADFLFDGLSMFTTSLHHIEVGAFPTLSGLGPFGGMAISIPFLLLQGNAVDAFLKWPHLGLIQPTAGIEGLACKRALREYALWFDAAFSLFRATTVARNVQATILFSESARGFAFAGPGFLSGPGMVL